jgi:hypothetical protein
MASGVKRLCLQSECIQALTPLMDSPANADPPHITYAAIQVEKVEFPDFEQQLFITSGDRSDGLQSEGSPKDWCLTSLAAIELPDASYFQVTCQSTSFIVDPPSNILTNQPPTALR